jgi:hypothetical protein
MITITILSDIRPFLSKILAFFFKPK